jgi:hypothetical protein
MVVPRPYPPGTPVTPPVLPNWPCASETRVVEDECSRSGSRERRVRLPKSPGDERRVCPRYPIGLDLRYTVHTGRKQFETGNGRTVNLSRSGLRFTTDRPLLCGLKIDLAISWPLLLDGVVQLQLVASGRVVWAQGNEVAVQIERHEFKTRGARLKSE